jgi:hypothetical protein
MVALLTEVKLKNILVILVSLGFVCFCVTYLGRKPITTSLLSQEQHTSYMEVAFHITVTTPAYLRSQLVFCQPPLTSRYDLATDRPNERLIHCRFKTTVNRGYAVVGFS